MVKLVLLVFTILYQWRQVVSDEEDCDLGLILKKNMLSFWNKEVFFIEKIKFIKQKKDRLDF